ncbi:MAG: N-acetylmuramoyl-L-alanine amidase, partial [Muribaculaceae bacterium]|nr:N-acetylmuramoyl-L-alanine amidase [Muribaculaceae bacterium]
MKKSLIAAMGLSMVAFAGTAKEADQLRIYINPGHGSWTPNDRPCTLVGHEEYNRVGTATTNFFETNTNLRKGFGVLEALRQYGLKFDPTLNQTGERHQIGAARDMANNIVMSHVKCGPYHDDNGTANQLGDATPADIEYYNRNLTEICQEVDANNFDMFISIHSNAASEGTTTNYPLFLYRGWDTPTQHDGCDEDLQATSRAIADACWAYSFQNPHMMWTSYG